MRFPEKFRIAGDPGESGAFRVPTGKRLASYGLLVIASNEEGWDHVSVSMADRCPKWEEMDAIKNLFFEPGEWAIQLHPPAADKVNLHTYCLHLWRPHGVEIPTPPAEMV